MLRQHAPESDKQSRLYVTEDLYDGFYDALEKDYGWEARKVLRLVRGLRPRRPARTLLDVACGTGRHLEVFARTLDCTGVDREPGMLAVARRRCPGVRLVQADMTTLDLGRRFDVVTCLFSAIAYVTTVPGLRATVRRLAAHLEPGGVLAVEPWLEPDEWESGHTAVLTVDEPDRKAARVSHASRRGDVSILDFEFLVADRRGIRHLHERHELRLYTRRQYVDAVEAAGLEVHVDEEGLFQRGLILGVAPLG